MNERRFFYETSGIYLTGACGDWTLFPGNSCRRMAFLVWQIPVDPATGEVAGTDVRTQARQVLKNIQAVLAEAGTTVQAVVKTTVFLKDLQDFQAFNEEYAKVFASEAPARSCVEVARLPKDVLVEIEAIVIIKP